MRHIISIKTVKLDNLFIIKWRITHLCNLSCSYCIQAKSRQLATTAQIESETEILLNAADEISTMIDNLPEQFTWIKLELVGGEVSIFNLTELLKRIKSERLYRIQLTTNFIQSADYYNNLALYLASRNIELTMTASYHAAYISFDDYFVKALSVSKKCKIFSCEMVSVRENQTEVEAFRAECEKQGLFYLIDADIRIESSTSRKNGELINGGNAERNTRYIVKYTDDGTEGEEAYLTRNGFVTDGRYFENMLNKIIHTRGLVCSHSWDFLYIEADKAVGRTAESNDCGNKMKIADFKAVKPAPCQHGGCTLCGQMSLYKANQKLMTIN